MEWIVSLYDGCINYVDQQLGELAALLRDLEIYDETLLVVTSDHGEEFLDHGMLSHRQRGYEEFAHIPLLMKLPDSRLGGRRVPHLAVMVDLMPTILEIVGIPVNREVQGESLLPAMAAGRPVRDLATIWRILRTEKWKYFPNQKMLFDLESDPGEKHNVYASHPGVVARFEERAQYLDDRDRRYAAALANGAGEADRDVELGEEHIEELKALGYI